MRGRFRLQLSIGRSPLQAVWPRTVEKPGHRFKDMKRKKPAPIFHPALLEVNEFAAARIRFAENKALEAERRYHQADEGFHEMLNRSQQIHRSNEMLRKRVKTLIKIIREREKVIQVYEQDWPPPR